VELSSVLSKEVCPSCYTSTVLIAPPCLPPITCSGPLTAPGSTGCTRTVDVRPTTITIPGVNPACPSTPRVTSNLGCPPTPACYESLCVTVTLGIFTGGPIRTIVTELPLTCVATTTYTFPLSTTTSVQVGPTATPPPFPVFPPGDD
jgi:hypothetical protein